MGWCRLDLEEGQTVRSRGRGRLRTGLAAQLAGLSCCQRVIRFLSDSHACFSKSSFNSETTSHAARRSDQKQRPTHLVTASQPDAINLAIRSSASSQSRRSVRRAIWRSGRGVGATTTEVERMEAALAGEDRAQ